MTQEELNKACEWLDKRIEYFTEDTRKFYKAFFRNFRKAMESYIDTETSKQLSEEMTREIVKQIDPLFEKCLADVNPDTRAEVRRNMALTSLTWQDVQKIVEIADEMLQTAHNRVEWVNVSENCKPLDDRRKKILLDAIDIWIQEEKLNEKKMKHTCLDCKHRAEEGHERFNGNCIDFYFPCSKKSKNVVKVSVTLDHKKCNEFELK